MTATQQQTKTFLLGVGAQKAGTSWLHDQLHKRSDANFGYLKEYHVLDALTLDEFKSFLPQHPFPWQWRTWRRRRFIRNTDRYFDYFAKLLSNPSIKLTGDITPSYGCLSADTFRWVRDQFDQRGITTRIVFLLRDPVERVLSQQRMKLKKSGSLKPEQEVMQLRRAAAKLQKKPSQRSNYSQTLRHLYEAFDEQDILVALYEQLFTEPIFQRLCNHLNIDYIEPNWGQRVNESRSTTSTPDDILAMLGASQRETYQALASQYPQLKIQTHWPTASRWCA